MSTAPTPTAMWYVLYHDADGRLKVVHAAFDQLVMAERCKNDFAGERKAFVVMRVSRLPGDEEVQDG